MKKRVTFFGVLICAATLRVFCAAAPAGAAIHKALPQIDDYATICALPDGGAMIAYMPAKAETGLAFLRLDADGNTVFEKTVKGFPFAFPMEMSASGNHVAMYGEGLALFDLDGNHLWESPWAQGRATYVLLRENGLLAGIGATLYHVSLDGDVLREQDIAPENAYSGRIACIKQTNDNHLLIGGRIRLLPQGYKKRDITEDDDGYLYLPDGSFYDAPSVAWVTMVSPDGSAQWVYSSDPDEIFVESFESVNDLHVDANGDILLAVEGRDEGYYLAFLRRLDGNTGMLTGSHRCAFGTDFSVIDRIFAGHDGAAQLVGMAAPNMPNSAKIVPDGGEYAYDRGGAWDCAVVASLPGLALAPTGFVEFVTLAYPRASVGADGALWMIGSTAGHEPAQAVKYESINVIKQEIDK